MKEGEEGECSTSAPAGRVSTSAGKTSRPPPFQCSTARVSRLREWGWAGRGSSGFAPSLTDKGSLFLFSVLSSSLQSIVCTGRRQWHPDPILIHCIQSCEVSCLPLPNPSSLVCFTHREVSLPNSRSHAYALCFIS